MDMKENNSKRNLGYLDSKSTALFLCDIQERFEKSIELFDMVVSNAKRVVQASNLMNIPIIATEQYPKVRLDNFY